MCPFKTIAMPEVPSGLPQLPIYIYDLRHGKNLSSGQSDKGICCSFTYYLLGTKEYDS